MGSAASSTSTRAQSGGSESPPDTAEGGVEGLSPSSSSDAGPVKFNAIIFGDDFLERFSARPGDSRRGVSSNEKRIPPYESSSFSSSSSSSSDSPTRPPLEGAIRSAPSRSHQDAEEDESYLSRPPPRPTFWMPFLGTPPSSSSSPSQPEAEPPSVARSQRNETLEKFREERRQRVRELTEQIAAFDAEARTQSRGFDEHRPSAPFLQGPCGAQQAAVANCFRRAQDSHESNEKTSANIFKGECRAAVESLKLCMQSYAEAGNIGSS